MQGVGEGAGEEQAKVVRPAVVASAVRIVLPSDLLRHRRDTASPFWDFYSAAVSDFDTAVCDVVPETAASYPHSDKPVYLEATFAQFWGSEISDFCTTRVLLRGLISMF